MKNNTTNTELTNELTTRLAMISQSGVRGYIYNLMVKHLNGEISSQVALDQHRMVSDLLESFRLEIKAVEVSASINIAEQARLIPKNYQEYVDMLP